MVIGLDFFLFSFLVLCSGTPEDFLFEDPLLAFFDGAGVPFVGATGGAFATSGAEPLSFISVSSDCGTVAGVVPGAALSVSPLVSATARICFSL